MRSKYCIREPLLRNVTPNEGKCHYHNSFSVEFIKQNSISGGKDCCCCCGGGKTAPWHCIKKKFSLLSVEKIPRTLAMLARRDFFMQRPRITQTRMAKTGHICSTAQICTPARCETKGSNPRPVGCPSAAQPPHYTSSI